MFLYNFLFNFLLNFLLSFVLNFFSTLSVIVVSLVTTANHYTSATKERTIILPVMIMSLFIFFAFFMHKNVNSNKGLTTYMIFISMSILIGMGFYVSTISFIIIIFCMRYFFNGIFNFFTDQEEDLLSSENDEIINLNEGWNIMSFYNEPDNMNFVNIIQPLIDE